VVKLARLSVVVKLSRVVESATVVILAGLALGQIGHPGNSFVATVVKLAGQFSTAAVTDSLPVQESGPVFGSVSRGWSSVAAPASRIGFDTTGRGSICSRILAVASIFLAVGLMALLRVDDKLSSCFLFIPGLLEQFLSQFGEVKGS
jgi:hypothetical protein